MEFLPQPANQQFEWDELLCWGYLWLVCGAVSCVLSYVPEL